MTQKIRFHLDENLSNAIADGLSPRGIDVTTTPKTGLLKKNSEVRIQESESRRDSKILANAVLSASRTKFILNSGS